MCPGANRGQLQGQPRGSGGDSKVIEAKKNCEERTDEHTYGQTDVSVEIVI